jgi:hypothetical protein
MIAHPPGVAPIKGAKTVATRVVVERREFRDWWGRVERVETRRVAYSLHPTKGWRKASASDWRKAR